ncbi:hypothetical protein IG631_04096 [Alternaria alternata]|nr:hypothetical protein IG631_04096 [Alternaria alternata]
MNMLHIWGVKREAVMIRRRQRPMKMPTSSHVLPDRRSPWRLAPFLAVACTSAPSSPPAEQASPSAAGPSCTVPWTRLKQYRPWRA